MNALVAIPTKYKGYQFRSRLEARWAGFFDLMGVSWEYEPEGFMLPSGRQYLPDFRLSFPRVDREPAQVWCEVKPYGVTTDPKFDAFSSALRAQSEARHTCEAWRMLEDDGDGDAGALPCKACEAPEAYTEARLLSGDPVDYYASCASGGTMPGEQIGRFVCLGCLSVCDDCAWYCITDSRSKQFRYQCDFCDFTTKFCQTEFLYGFSPKTFAGERLPFPVWADQGSIYTSVYDVINFRKIALHHAAKARSARFGG